VIAKIAKHNFCKEAQAAPLHERSPGGLSQKMINHRTLNATSITEILRVKTNRKTQILRFVFLSWIFAVNLPTHK
jgi:hypothetical protein